MNVIKIIYVCHQFNKSLSCLDISLLSIRSPHLWMFQSCPVTGLRYSIMLITTCNAEKRLEKNTHALKGEIRNTFNLISKERVKFFEQNSSNLMTISWKIRKLCHFEFSQIFKKHFLTSRYMTMQMSELMMSSPHNFPIILYTEMTKISYFSYENVNGLVVYKTV